MAILMDLWITTTFITSDENFGFDGRRMFVILSVEMEEYGENLL